MKAFIAAATLASLSTLAQAVVVHGDLLKGLGNHWTARFDIVNDGTVPAVSNFTVYFDWQTVSNLQVISSPAGWDTITIDPDAALASDGFMDAHVVDPVDALASGQALGGFGVAFDWSAAQGAPQGFAFAVYDASFNAVFAGRTTATSNAVPAPGSLWLAAVALTALVAVRARSRNAG